MADRAYRDEATVNSAPHIKFAPEGISGFKEGKKSITPAKPGNHKDFALISARRFAPWGQLMAAEPPGKPGLGIKSFWSQNVAIVFSVRAHAKAREFSLSLVSRHPLVLRADIPEEPQSGRANRLLLSELEKALSCSVKIIAGNKSRKKTLAAACSEEKILQAAGEYGKKA